MSMITRLRYLCTVVETGSISKASRVLDLQPSSISRQLTALENELGVRLLNRTTRNIGLTEAGHTYYHYAQRIIADLDEAARVVNDLQDKPQGRLRLSMTVGFGELCVLPLLPAFLKQYPDIKVDLELTARVVDLVEDNVDIAIRTGHLADSNLVAVKLADNDFILCASPGYLQQRGTPETPEALAAFDCIRYGYAGWRDWYLMGEKPVRLAVPEGVTVRTINGQKQLAIHSGGLSLLPRWAVRRELADGSLVHVLRHCTLSPYDSLTSTFAIYPRRDLISPKVRVFLDFLKANLAQD